jgi:hypothetical protein
MKMDDIELIGSFQNLSQHHVMMRQLVDAVCIQPERPRTARNQLC